SPSLHSKIKINKSQNGNPLIQTIKSKNVPFEFTSLIQSDYLINSQTFVLFLSLRYHKLHPEYIFNRLKKFGFGAQSSSTNVLKILLCVLDIENSGNTHYWEILKSLLKVCIFNDFTLILTWSFEEAGNYICVLKNLSAVSGNKGSSNKKLGISIKGELKEDYYSRLLNCLTSIKGINKSDVSRIVSSNSGIKNFKELVKDNGNELENINGWGPKKISRFKYVVNEPFIFNYDY
ncbi:DNA repair protein RAD10, partial [Ascoidea rubescens DSM 1968]